MFNFGSMFDDPFFGNVHETHRRHMQRMQQSMFDPGLMAIEGQQGHRNAEVSLARRGHHPHRSPSGSTQALQPFGMSPDPFSMGFGNMFGNMQSMMSNMHQSFEDMSNNPNVHSYSQSSFTSFSSAGAGPPKVYQATSSTRKAPGGVKETRRSVRDSEAGLEKMAVGHHLGERAHVVSRSRNTRTQETEEQQDFNNLDETEADSFNQEWRQRAQPLMGQHSNGSRHRNATPAITNGTPQTRHEHNTVRRDRSPMRPKGPSHGGRKHGNSNRHNDNTRY
ncbi:myeloid leukemia factor 2-like [Asterias rubens]|uniref:myeloid leukemia factor 2-like n=1 Tax=Asterias rubens TaxID=7604 RepID=UPI0014553A68|nr:myeloid leukemia factor 2-like [Asterias rubens]